MIPAGRVSRADDEGRQKDGVLGVKMTSGIQMLHKGLPKARTAPDKAAIRRMVNSEG